MNTDLISRKALLEILRHLNDEPEDMMSDEYCEWDNMCADDMLDKVLEIVEAFPVIDAEPVRHGEWGDYRINGYDGLHPVYETQCSLCGGYARFTYRFCPHCGAKMDGGIQNEKEL